MCRDIHNCTCGPANPIGFDDLEDKSEWDGSKSPEVTEDEIDTDADRELRKQSGGHITSRSDVGRYECVGCKGTGVIRVYRRGGGWGQRGEAKKCWKGCGGTGYTKTSPEVRAKNRARARTRKQLKAQKLRDQAQAWLDANPAINAWFEKNRGNPSWAFPDDLHQKLFQYGNLTPKQIAAIEKCIEKDAARQAEWAAKAPKDGIDLRHMRSGYYAVPGGETRLKVKIDVIVTGKWAGWVFVKDGAEYGGKKRYGSQKPGATYTGDIQEELRAIAADPMAAMAAYGHLVGRCGMCNRKLEDEQSIAMGIGPVCAQKFA